MPGFRINQRWHLLFLIASVVFIVSHVLSNAVCFHCPLFPLLVLTHLASLFSAYIMYRFIIAFDVSGSALHGWTSLYMQGLLFHHGPHVTGGHQRHPATTLPCPAAKAQPTAKSLSIFSHNPFNVAQLWGGE